MSIINNKTRIQATIEKDFKKQLELVAKNKIGTFKKLLITDLITCFVVLFAHFI